jgi:hypothetical protein
MSPSLLCCQWALDDCCAMYLHPHPVPNQQSLALDGNNLGSSPASLPPTVFQPIASTLVNLTLQSNALDAVPSTALSVLTNLQVLDLDFNAIAQLGPNDLRWGYPKRGCLAGVGAASRVLAWQCKQMGDGGVRWEGPREGPVHCSCTHALTPAFPWPEPCCLYSEHTA